MEGQDTKIGDSSAISIFVVGTRHYAFCYSVPKCSFLLFKIKEKINLLHSKSSSERSLLKQKIL